MSSSSSSSNPFASARTPSAIAPRTRWSESPSEIQDRMRRRFIERLAQRVKKIRFCLVERDWGGIRNECRQLRGSGENFGFHELTRVSSSTEILLPSGDSPRVRSNPVARQAVDQLVSVIDQILMENSFGRSV